MGKNGFYFFEANGIKYYASFPAKNRFNVAVAVPIAENLYFAKAVDVSLGKKVATADIYAGIANSGAPVVRAPKKVGRVRFNARDAEEYLKALDPADPERFAEACDALTLFALVLLRQSSKNNAWG